MAYSGFDNLKKEKMLIRRLLSVLIH